jgi:AraC family transcriptional regulator
VETAATSIEAPNTTFGPWLLDGYALTWIVEGGGVTSLDDHDIPTSPGTVILMRRKMVLRHNWGPRRSYQSFVVFKMDDVPPPWPPREDWPLVRTLDDDHVLFMLWRYLLVHDLKSPQVLPLVLPTVELMLRVFVADPSGKMAKVSPTIPEAVDRAVTAMRKHLEAQPDQALRLDELARQVHCTPQHLCRLFKNSLQASPMDCAQALRLEACSSLLERTELTIAQIADRFGYSSQFAFSKAFKRAYGVTPSRHRSDFRSNRVSRPAGLMFRHHPMRRYFYESETEPAKMQE